MNRRRFSKISITLVTASCSSAHGNPSPKPQAKLAYPDGNTAIPKNIPYGKAFSNMILRIITEGQNAPDAKIGLHAPGIIFGRVDYCLYDNYISSYSKHKAYRDASGNYVLLMTCWYQMYKQFTSRQLQLSDEAPAREFLRRLDSVALALETAAGKIKAEE